MSAEDFEDRLSNLWGFPRLTLVTATTDELVANGKSSLLQSDVLREELAAFVEWYKDRERYYEFLSAAIIDAYQQQNRFFRPEWPDSDGRPRWSADPNALMDDAEAISSMRQLTSAYWQLWRDIDILNMETREMNDLLNEEIQDRGN